MTKRIKTQLTLGDVLNKDEMDYLEDSLKVYNMALEAQEAVALEDWGEGKMVKSVHEAVSVSSPIPYEVFVDLYWSFDQYRFFRSEFENMVDWKECDKELYDRHICMDSFTRKRLESSIFEKLEEMDTEYMRDRWW